MKTGMLALVALVALAAALPGCSTSPKDEAGKEALSGKADAALGAFKSEDSSLNDLLAKSVGYAVFPEVGKAGLIAGGAYGRGEVFEHGARVGFADISQATIGLQIGAQTYDELIIFLTPEKLNDFKSDRFAFSANASAIAIKAGAAASADYSKGVVVFIRSTGGLMAEASVGGQRFTYKPR